MSDVYPVFVEFIINSSVGVYFCSVVNTCVSKLLTLCTTSPGHKHTLNHSVVNFRGKIFSVENDGKTRISAQIFYQKTKQVYRIQLGMRG